MVRLFYLFLLLITLSACPLGKNKGNSGGFAGTHSVSSQEEAMTKLGYSKSFDKEGHGHCLNTFVGKNLAIDELTKDMDQIKDELDCEKKCPFDYSILKRDQSPFNILAFTNSQANFSQSIGRGVCDGFVQMNQALHHLAMWDQKKTNTYTDGECGNRKDGQMSLKCLEMYKSKIYQMTKSFQAVDIPGFSNLYEFSSHPAIQEILKPEIVRLHNVEWQPFQYDPETLEKEMALNKTPLLMINGASHAVMVYKMQVKNGQKTFCLRDPNIIPNGLFQSNQVQTCKDYLWKSPRGWERVTNGQRSLTRKIISSQTDQQRHHRYVEGVQRYCMNRCQKALQGQ